MRRLGGRAVFAGRFTAALRALVPGLAGVAGVPYRTFAAYNVAGGVLWATGFVLLGFAAGPAWRTAERFAGRLRGRHPATGFFAALPVRKASGTNPTDSQKKNVAASLSISALPISSSTS